MHRSRPRRGAAGPTGSAVATRRLALAAVLAGVAVLAGSALPAAARTLALEWSHSGVDSAGNPARFRIHIGSAARDYDTRVDIGALTPSGGRYRYDLEVASADPVYVAIQAQSVAASSGLSPDRRYGSELPPALDPDRSSASHPDLLLAPSPDSLLWYDTAPDNSLDRDDSLFEADATADALFTTSSAINIQSHLLAPGSAQWMSYEFRGRMLMTDPRAGIGVTVASDYPYSDAYYRLRAFDGSSFHFSPHPAGAPCESDDTGVIPTANVWHHFRVQFENSGVASIVRARVWRDGESEPGDWTVNCRDGRATRRVSGTAGVWAMGTGAKYWADLSVIALEPLEAPAPPNPPFLLPPGL